MWHDGDSFLICFISKYSLDQNIWIIMESNMMDNETEKRERERQRENTFILMQPKTDDQII